MAPVLRSLVGGVNRRVMKIEMVFEVTTMES